MFLSCLMWSAWGFEFFSMKPIFHVGKPSCHPHTSIRKPQSAPKSFLCSSHLFSQALSGFPVPKPAIISPCEPVLACSHGYAQISLKQQRFILSQFHSWYHWAETLGLARPPSDTKGMDNSPGHSDFGDKHRLACDFISPVPAPQWPSPLPPM